MDQIAEREVSEATEPVTTGSVAERCIETFVRVMPRLARSFKSRMRSGPLTPQQMFMLMEIQDLAERNADGAQPGELSRHCGLSGPAVTAVLDDLVDGGYCVRTHGERDRRKVFVRPTATGLESLAETRRGAATGIREMLSDWDDERRLRLIAVLGDLDEAVDAYLERMRS